MKNGPMKIMKESNVIYFRKRCAWIVRYIPDYVQILPNSWRKMFHDDYPLVKLN